MWIDSSRMRFKQFKCFWNGIVPESSRQGMAPQQPLRPQPHAAQYAKSLDRVVGVARTRGLVAAGTRKQNGEVGFVATQRQQRRPHRKGMGFRLPNRRSRSCSSAAKGVLSTLLFGCMTMSHPAGISCRWQRTISRSRRRMRLRTTAPPKAFLMLKPKRLNASSLERTKTVKWVLEKRFPAR